MENYTKEDLFNLSLDNKVKLINYVMLFTDSDYGSYSIQNLSGD